MFDAFKNMSNLTAMMGRAKELQEKVKSLQESMGRSEFTGDPTTGGVTATVNGRLELLRLSIDKTKVDPANFELLEHLIVSAVNAAQVKAASALKDQMARLAGEMGLPPEMLPG